MIHSPIFLYSSWRTGGTALAMALKKDNILFYDPLNPALIDFESAINASTEGWSSNHPPGFKYFEEYSSIFNGRKPDNFPNLKLYKFRNSPQEFRDQLVEYFWEFLEYAKSTNKSAVFKFEQLEGHVDFLRIEFPEAIHIAVVRDPIEQYDSWLEQLALGNSFFFDSAFDLINGDPEFFRGSSKLDKRSHEQIFEVYYSNLLTLRPHFDISINLYKDSKEEFISDLPTNHFKKLFLSAFLELQNFEKQPTAETKYVRMKTRALELTQQRDELTQQRHELTQQRDELTQQRDELTQQRDELTQQRDELTQQRDELTQQRDELTQQRDELTQQRDELTQQMDTFLNSTIWKLSKPLRDLINLLKR